MSGKTLTTEQVLAKKKREKAEKRKSDLELSKQTLVTLRTAKGHKQDRVKNPTKYQDKDNASVEEDPTNPSYYTRGKSEIIDIMEILVFNRGSAIKYIYRAGQKDPGNLAKEIGDLEKAQWYLSREIDRLKEM